MSGLLEIGQPQPGETVVVAAASGAVGSVVGQIAKIKGCRVVGIAGGPEKCACVVEELGFDACIDHRDRRSARASSPRPARRASTSISRMSAARCFGAVLPLLNEFARVPVCGLIAQYNDTEAADAEGPDMFSVLRKRLTCAALSLGFRRPAGRFPARNVAMAARGQLKYREFVIEVWRTRRAPSWACCTARISAS